MSNNNTNNSVDDEPEEAGKTWGAWFKDNWYWVLPLLLLALAGIVAAIVWYMRSPMAFSLSGFTVPAASLSQPSVPVAAPLPQPSVPASPLPQPPAPVTVPIQSPQLQGASAPSMARRYRLPTINPNVPKNAIGVTVDQFEGYRQMYPSLQPLISNGISYLTLPDGSAVGAYMAS